MAIYEYSEHSLLDQVHILTNEMGGMRAYLCARQNATPEQLRVTKQALRAQGFECVPTLYENKPVLEVRGFTKPEQILDSVQHLGLTRGTPSVKQDPEEARNPGKKAHSNTLRLAGYSYNVGDAAYMVYTVGPLSEKWKELPKQGRFFGIVGVLAGVGYGLGSLCLTFFGSKDQSVNTIKTATSKIERFARKEGYNVPPETTIAYVNRKPEHGLWGKTKALIARYPSEALNTIYTGVGMCIAATSLYRGTRPISPTLTGKELAHAKLDRHNELIDVGLGAVTAASALIGITVKETKPVEGDPKRSGIGGVVDWIKEKPLRATGIGYGIATAWHGLATYKHWKDGTGEDPKYLKYRAVFIAANVISEILLTMSSKGHGTGVKPDASIDDSVMATAAELILRQPKEQREAVIGQLAGYMASPEVLGTKAADVEKNLRQHLDMLDNNPWTKHFTGYDKAVEESVPAPAMPATNIPGTKVNAAQHAAMLVDPSAQSVAMH